MTGTNQPSVEEKLYDEAETLIIRAWISFRETPDTMTPRLQRMILEGERFNISDIEDFIEIVKSVTDANPFLQADLAALEVVAARLGSAVMALWIERRAEGGAP